MSCFYELVITELGPNRIQLLAYIRRYFRTQLFEVQMIAAKLPLKIAEGTLGDLNIVMNDLQKLGAHTEIRPLLAEH